MDNVSRSLFERMVSCAVLCRTEAVNRHRANQPLADMAAHQLWCESEAVRRDYIAACIDKAEQVRLAWDTLHKLADLYLTSGTQLPFDLAIFHAQAVNRQLTRPRKGADRLAGRDWAIAATVAYILSALRERPEVKPMRSENAPICRQRSVCDAVAVPWMKSYATVAGIWKRSPLKCAVEKSL